MSYEGWLPPCAICNGSVSLEESKTDERGMAVHENCYVWTVELGKPRKRMARADAVGRNQVAYFTSQPAGAA
jgi:hypothetical protein